MRDHPRGGPPSATAPENLEKSEQVRVILSFRSVASLPAAAINADCWALSCHLLRPSVDSASPGTVYARVLRRVVTTCTSAPRVPVSAADLGK